MYGYCEGCEDHPKWDIGLGVPTVCISCEVINITPDVARRYLYRNVAAEYRKGISDFHQMPDIPGWS